LCSATTGESCSATSVTVQLVQTWNDLPEDVTSAESLTIFRRLLKTHLFRKSFPDYWLDINWLSPVDLAVVLLLRDHLWNLLIDYWLISERDVCDTYSWWERINGMIIIINIIIISSTSWFFDSLEWTDCCTSLSLSLSNYTSTTTITLYSIETHTSVTADYTECHHPTAVYWVLSQSLRLGTLLDATAADSSVTKVTILASAVAYRPATATAASRQMTNEPNEPNRHRKWHE